MRKRENRYLESPRWGRIPGDAPEPPCVAYPVISDGWGRRTRLILATLGTLEPEQYARHVEAIVNTASLGADRPRWWGVVRRRRAMARGYEEIDSAVLQYALAVASPAHLAALDREAVRGWLRSPSTAVRLYAVAVLRHSEGRA